MNPAGPVMADTPVSGPQRVTLGWLALGAALVMLSLGHEGKRLFQVLVLALPVWLCLYWPGRHGAVRFVQAVFAAVMGLLFIVDAAIRGFLGDAYDASPASAMVITAMANTTAQESSEFMAIHGPRLWGWKLGVVLALALLLGWLWRWCQQPPWPVKACGWRRAVILSVSVLVLIAVASKPWRKHHPMLFWPAWLTEVQSLRAQWTDLADHRQRLRQAARQQQPVTTPASPDTMVLVIGESTNRQNMSLYGYPRDTTPELRRLQNAEGDRLGVFRHAWSVDATTVPALRNFFHFGQAQGPQHLLALAAQAGYRTWWISNHDDLAIDQQHAQLADQVHRLNKTPGRSGRSLDLNTLPVLKAALQDAAPRKLIVVHLLGSHPHYEFRYPQDRALFSQVSDEVDQGMKDLGRSARVRALRKDYDASIHYHDSVLAATLDLTRQQGQKATWVYFSDHGQEVGHVSDHAGHAVTSAEGYRVPLLVWGSTIGPWPPHTFVQPVRTDWLGHSVMRLLGIEWPGHEPQQDVFDGRYRFIAPGLPMVSDFAS